MAHVQSSLGSVSPFAKIAAVFAEIGGFLVRVSEANSRVREMDRLNAMSDEELARMGLKREDIVLHVFDGDL